jgi:hypothetical protein
MTRQEYVYLPEDKRPERCALAWDMAADIRLQLTRRELLMITDDIDFEIFRPDQWVVLYKLHCKISRDLWIWKRNLYLEYFP